MLQSNDNKGYLLYESKEKSLDVSGESRAKSSSCTSSLLKVLRFLYQYSIGSCIFSLLSCSEYFHGDEPYESAETEVELDILSPGDLKKTPES